MKKLVVFATALVFALGLFAGVGPFEQNAQAKTTFVTIGTGGITGVYYPTGGAIAKMVNAKKDVYGIRAPSATNSSRTVTTASSRKNLGWLRRRRPQSQRDPGRYQHPNHPPALAHLSPHDTPPSNRTPIGRQAFYRQSGRVAILRPSCQGTAGPEGYSTYSAGDASQAQPSN